MWGCAEGASSLRHILLIILHLGIENPTLAGMKQHTSNHPENMRYSLIVKMDQERLKCPCEPLTKCGFARGPEQSYQ